ncbi:MAG: hypothetical protein QM820_19430 [Minicystis sp.]
MGNASIIKDTHPQLDFANIKQRGLKALNLALVYAAEIGPRLGPNLVSELQNDLGTLGVVVPGAKQAHDEAQGATVTQTVVLSRGYEKASVVRTAVRKAKASDEVKKAYGVGQRMDRRLVRDVKAALNQIIDRATKVPAEAASLGILPQDIDAMKELVETISDAHQTQDEKQASAPQTTKQRNATGNRILAAIGRIEGAGLIHFTDDPTVRASFEALGVGVGKGRKKGAATKKGEKAKPATGTPKPVADASAPAAEAPKPPAETPKSSAEAPNPPAEGPSSTPQG